MLAQLRWERPYRRELTMDLGLQGKIAAVTGGTAGIGFAVAQLLLSEGASVAICGRDTSRMEAAKRLLLARCKDGELLAVGCDVANKDDVARFAAGVEDWKGACDILINNAGAGRFTAFSDTTDEAWRQELELKFFGLIHPVRAFKPLLDRSSSAAILCVNSLLAYQPEPHMIATAAARAGAQNLVKSLAREFAPRIRVNSVVLGLIESAQWERRFDAREDCAQSREDWYGDLARSRQIPLGRLGDPQEVARAIVFLCSPAASFITGAQLEISGGISRYM